MNESLEQFAAKAVGIVVLCWSMGWVLGMVFRRYAAR